VPSGFDSTFIEPYISGVAIVTFSNNEDSGAVISGFTLRNSYNAPAININELVP